MNWRRDRAAHGFLLSGDLTVTGRTYHEAMSIMVSFFTLLTSVQGNRRITLMEEHNRA